MERGTVSRARPLLDRERLRVVVEVRMGSGEIREVTLPDREVAAILPRSILVGGSCRAPVALLGTLEPIVARMTEGRVVRMWQYDGRWYCSFLPWKSVRFAAGEEHGPPAAAPPDGTSPGNPPPGASSGVEPGERLVPALHQDPEGHGDVQRPLRTRERDADPPEG